MSTHEHTDHPADATDDLITGRHRDAAGVEHDLVTEATVGSRSGTVADPDEETVTDATVGPGTQTGVVTDR